MKRNHKHAEMIRRGLDDDSLEVEIKDSYGNWVKATPEWHEECDYRLKPKMIKVGEHEFPEPIGLLLLLGKMFG